MSAGLSRFLVPGTDLDVADAYAGIAERAGSEVFGFEEEHALVDIETTGFDPEHDSVIEVAAVIMRGPEVLESFETLVNPGRPIPPEITRLTGITDEQVADAPPPEAAAIALSEFVDGRDVVAHNAPFDQRFLERLAGSARFPGAWIDTLQLALIAFPRLSSHRLCDIAEAFSGSVASHRAADDVRALVTVWRAVLCGLDDLGPPLLGRLAALAPSTEWPQRFVLSHLAAGSKAISFDQVEVRSARTTAQRCVALPDAEDIECACPEPDEVAAEFSLQGAAGRMYDGYERRDEQAQMALATTRALAKGSCIAVEAGTGVGKSLAYLVPAVRFALLNGVGVGVATKTNALMDQLVYGELPSLCAAMDVPLRFVSLKGYEHYLCLRKFDRFANSLDDDAEPAIVGAVAALMAWVAQSSWGDLDSTNVHLRRDIRNEISASVADCTRKRCRFYPHLCFVHGARRRASSAHVVVTNHALLFRDVVAAGGILPPIRHWIVDEAHAAEAEARKQLSMECSRLELSVVLGALGGSRSGLLQAARKKVRSFGMPDDSAVFGAIAEMERGVSEAITLAGSLFEFVHDVSPADTDGYDTREVRVDRAMRESGPWGTVDRVGRSLALRLDTVLAAGRRLTTLLEAEGPKAAEVRADLAGLLTRLADQSIALVTVIDGEAEEYVYHCTIDSRRGGRADRLAASRLDVGEALAEAFYPRIRSIVYTSATIAAGEDFGHFAYAVGLDRLPEESREMVRLPSSYDFERQMAVFVPADLAEPRSPEYLAGLEELLFGIHVAMDGSVLTLFTNRRDMDRLYRLLEPRLAEEDLSLLVQSRGVSAKRLRDEFLADGSSSLFATKSFWEGFDAPGDTLRCVVVPKLPFGQVGDPLTREREERYGKAAWERFYLPEAILELKQAAGRLIRSASDTGCLVIADSRVLTQRYGRRFLSALPVLRVEELSSERMIEEVASRFGSLAGRRDPHASRAASAATAERTSAGSRTSARPR